MDSITASALLDRFVSDSSREYESLDVSGRITFEQPNSKKSPVFFKGCEFDDVLFSGYFEGIEIRFVDCVFRRGCSAISAGYDGDSGLKLKFYGSTMQKLHISHSKLNGVVMEDCQIENRLYIASLSVPAGDLFLNRTWVKSKSEFRDLNIKQGVFTIRDSEFQDHVIIDKPVCNNLGLAEARIETNLYISKPTSTGVGKGEIVLRHVETKGALWLTVDHDLKSVIISGRFGKGWFFELRKDFVSNHPPRIGCLEIGDTQSDGIGKIDGLADCQDICIDELKFSESTVIDSSMYVDSLVTGKILLSGFFGARKVAFSNCTTHELEILNFFNGSNLILNNFSFEGEQPTLRITNSTIGETYTLGCDWADLSQIQCENSAIHGLKTSGQVWWGDEVFDGSSPGSKREFYRQLKYSQEKQGDSFKALEFRAVEARGLAQGRELKKSDRLILLLGLINSNGTNWVRPLLVLFFLSILFYTAIISTVDHNPALSDYSTGHGEFMDWLNLWCKEFQTWPQLLNPAHSLKKIYPAEAGFGLGFWPFFIDLIWKVFLAILIFQLVVAFRKFVKK